MFLRQYYSHKSVGIAAYAKSLFNASKQFRSVKSNVSVYHFANSSRFCLLKLVFSTGVKVTIVHDVYPRTKPFRWLAYVFCSLIAIFSTKVIVHSNFAKVSFLRFSIVSPRKIQVLQIPYDAVDLSLKRDLKKVLVLGGITRNRGQHTYLPALEELLQNGYKVHVIGFMLDDEFKTNARRLGINVRGYLPDDKLIYEIATSRVALVLRQSSVGESSGMVALCHSVKTPVLVSNIGSLKEQVLLPNRIPLNSKSFLSLVKQSKCRPAPAHQWSVFVEVILREFK